MPEPDPDLAHHAAVLPYRPQHLVLLRAYWNEERERAIRVAAVRNLLPDDADKLAGAAVVVMRSLMVELLHEFPGRPPDEVAWVAEAIMHLALEVRGEGLPVAPPRH